MKLDGSIHWTKSNHKYEFGFHAFIQNLKILRVCFLIYIYMFLKIYSFVLTVKDEIPNSLDISNILSFKRVYNFLPIKIVLLVEKVCNLF